MGFEAEWQRWQDARWRLIAGRHGIAALTATVWLSAQEQTVPGVAGRWRADADVVVGTGLADAGFERTDGTPVDDAVVLHAGETLHVGDALLRAFVREGVPALRRIDPSAERRVRLRSIAAYRPDPAWVVTARWTPIAEPIEVEQVDGHRTEQGDAGELEFELAGAARRLTATRAARELAVVFRDATGEDDAYAFRFLRPALPDEQGSTTLDFNRAFLPPCAFSDHYVCPMPPRGNALDVAVTAGERLPIYEES
jgi:uncharacterized protein